MKNYLNEIKKYPLLTREEERAALIAAKSGDEEARDLLINSNLRFVVSQAKGYLNQGLSMEDLVGEGNYGLIQALERFNLNYPNKFITYAVWWIRHYIFQALSAANSGSVRLPTNKQQILVKIAKSRDKLEQQLHRSPTKEELEKELGINLDNYINAGHNYVSLDTSYMEEGGSSLQEILPDEKQDPEKQIIDDSLSKDIEDLLATITDERERTIIRYYHGLNLIRTHTLEEIGSFFGISRERVRQIKEKTLLKIADNPKYDYLKQHLLD